MYTAKMSEVHDIVKKLKKDKKLGEFLHVEDNMGRTLTPLNIAVLDHGDGIWDSPEMAELVDKGDSLTLLDDGEYDVVIGSRALCTHPQTLKYTVAQIETIRKHVRKQRKEQS